MLSNLGELEKHLGDNDLESEAEELFCNRCRGEDINHQLEPLAVSLALPVDRDFTSAQIDAVKWKLNMHNSSRLSILRLMAGISETTLSVLVDEHASAVAEPARPRTNRAAYILSLIHI